MEKFNLKETINKVNEVYKSKGLVDASYTQSKEYKNKIKFGNWFFKRNKKRINKLLDKIDLGIKDIKIIGG